jgi:uncharacterized protein YlxW (UPF0749 family)
MASHPHKSEDADSWRTRLVAWLRARPLGWRLTVPVACAAAGLLATTSMINAQGTDLRGGRHTDLIGIVAEQRSTVQDLRRSLRNLQSDVDELAASVHGGRLDELHDQLDGLQPGAGLTALEGPGITVTLDDAPLDLPGSEDIDPKLLVVHQQDIQAVVNALWAGGAGGVAVQGQRIISSTGIKCVGNTVVLQGVPYSPPYRITAVGSTSALSDALEESTDVQTYLQYTDPPYSLGWSVREEARVRLAPYSGSLTLDYAHPSP